MYTAGYHGLRVRTWGALASGVRVRATCRSLRASSWLAGCSETGVMACPQGNRDLNSAMREGVCTFRPTARLWITPKFKVPLSHFQLVTNHLTGQDKLCKHTSKTKDSGSSLSPVAVSRLRICPLRSAQLPSQSAQKARAALFLHAGVENDGGRQDRVRVWGMGLADHRAVHHERGHRPLQPKVQSSWRHILARESPARGWPQCHLPSRPGRNSQKSALQWLYLVKYTRAFTI